MITGRTSISGAQNAGFNQLTDLLSISCFYLGFISSNLHHTSVEPSDLWVLSPDMRSDNYVNRSSLQHHTRKSGERKMNPYTSLMYLNHRSYNPAKVPKLQFRSRPSKCRGLTFITPNSTFCIIPSSEKYFNPVISLPFTFF